MLIYALLLKPMKLEEVSKPKHILHQVDVFALLLFVATCPKHLIGVHEIENYSEGLRSRPEWQQDTDLLSVIDAFDDVTELFRLLYEVLFEREELNVLDDEADFVIIVIGVGVIWLIFIAGARHACTIGILVLSILSDIISVLTTGSTGLPL